MLPLSQKSRAHVANQAASPLEAMLANRRVPCICPRQHEAEPPIGEMVGFTEAVVTIVERVRCSDCRRTWKRVNPR